MFYLVPTTRYIQLPNFPCTRSLKSELSICRDRAQELESSHAEELDTIRMEAAKDKAKMVAKANAQAKELKGKRQALLDYCSVLLFLCYFFVHLTFLLGTVSNIS